MKETDFQNELGRLHSASFGWALWCCDHRREEAEEVLQTAYLKVMEGAARFDGNSSLRTWFFSVIRRTAWEQRRKRWLRDQLLEAGSAAGLRRYARLIPRQWPADRRAIVFCAGPSLASLPGSARCCTWCFIRTSRLKKHREF